MATKIKTSAEKNNLLEALLNDEGDGSPFKNLIKRGVEKIIKETLESEGTELIRCDYYAHVLFVLI